MNTPDFDPSTPYEDCLWEPETMQEDYRRLHRNMIRFRYRTESIIKSIVPQEAKEQK